ncbi:SprT family zinc-dependent metalloprotease [Thalassomonas sp. RHCl1]|uniref:M48 family metallopeptidase n=1 Tax=Thalassomonas sp. RHCl1 TaxID=2995320 RepID=UPI00248B1B3C|nr:SprT family zinc-dependent metalloprotease [Thalassomonas sp. RHCl1]
MTIEYQLIRSDKRKTLGLQVKKGQVFVRAPRFVGAEQITALVQAKSAWLKAKVAEQQLLLENEVSLFCQDSEIWIRGTLKRLDIRDLPALGSAVASKARVREFEQVIELALPAAKLASGHEQVSLSVKKQLELWFKQQAQDYIPARLEYWSQATGLSYKSYKIRQYKARWGSCNSRAELSFNSLLMMAPDWVIDYVIVHELCHLQHLNHSPAFWQLVAGFYPQYALAKQWLKSNQMKLSWK